MFKLPAYVRMHWPSVAYMQGRLDLFRMNVFGLCSHHLTFSFYASDASCRRKDFGYLLCILFKFQRSTGGLREFSFYGEVIVELHTILQPTKEFSVCVSSFTSCL